VANRYLLSWPEYRRQLRVAGPGLVLFVVIALVLHAREERFPFGRWGEVVALLVCLGLSSAFDRWRISRRARRQGAKDG
jgi:hypothetical protein